MKYCIVFLLLILINSCGKIPEQKCASPSSVELNSTPSNFGYIKITQSDGTERKCSALVKGKSFYSVSIFTANHCFSSNNLIDGKISLFVNNEEIIIPDLDVKNNAMKIVEKLRVANHPEPEVFLKALLGTFSIMNRYLLREELSCYLAEKKRKPLHNS